MVRVILGYIIWGSRLGSPYLFRENIIWENLEVELDSKSPRALRVARASGTIVYGEMDDREIHGVSGNPERPKIE